MGKQQQQTRYEQEAAQEEGLGRQCLPMSGIGRAASYGNAAAAAYLSAQAGAQAAGAQAGEQGAASGASVEPQGLSKERQKALYEADRRMGSTPGAAGADGLRHGKAPERKNPDGSPRKDTVNIFDDTKEQSSGTSCGLLAGVVLKKLGLGRNPRVREITNYVTSGGPGGMEDLADKFGAWIPSTGKNLPQPADIFVVNNPEGGFAHVGMIKDADDSVWTTFNTGGGRGADDKAHEAARHVMTAEEKEAYNKRLSADQAAGGGMKDPTKDQKEARKAAILGGKKRDLSADEQAQVDKKIQKTPLNPADRYLQGDGKAPDAPADEPRKVHGWVDLDKLVAYANKKEPAAKK